MTNPLCATCDSPDNLSKSHGKGGLNDVCRGCFYIWYDGDIPRDDGVRGEDMRLASLKAKVAGSWPYNGSQLPLPTEEEKARAARELETVE